MKKFVPLFFFLCVGFTFGQKKELKKAEKLFETGDVQAASAILESSAALFDAADDKVKASLTFLEGKIAQSNEDFETAYSKFESLKGNSTVSSQLPQQMTAFSAAVVNSAIADNEAGAFAASASKLYLAYNVDKETNKDYLYYAASSAVNANDYTLALEYYNELKDIKYDGITTKYFATDDAQGAEIELSQTEYELYKKTKGYSNFREETSPSKYPEIVKNIALIYAQQGDNEKAMEAVKAARAETPNDLNLILTEANLYIELGEKERFQDLIKEAIAQDPNNAILYFNLGVVNGDMGNADQARTYYEKAIEIDSNYEAAYLNLVANILQRETPVVEEMNSISGTSKAENERYDSLKSKREDLYRECVPILKKLISLSKDQEAIKTLMNIYGTLGDTEGFKEMKALVE